MLPGNVEIQSDEYYQQAHDQTEPQHRLEWRQVKIKCYIRFGITAQKLQATNISEFVQLPAVTPV